MFLVGSPSSAALSLDANLLWFEVPREIVVSALAPAVSALERKNAGSVTGCAGSSRGDEGKECVAADLVVRGPAG